MPQVKLLLRWAVVVGWMGLIWYLSAQPDLRSGLTPDFFLRKLAHIFEFAVLMLLVRAAWRGSAWPGSVPIAALWSFLYALVDEWHQSFVPGRHGAVSDVVIDAVGIVLISGALWYWQKKLSHPSGTTTDEKSKP